MKINRQNSIVVIALTPSHCLAPQIAIAACRAGAFGVLDLGVQADPSFAKAALADVLHAVGTAKNWGIRWDTLGVDSRGLFNVQDILGSHAPVPLLTLAGIDFDQLRKTRDVARRLAREVFLEVQDLRCALEAEAAGYDGLILKGHEAGGCVSQRSSFILAQECHGKLRIPYWIAGGIGLHTGAAAVSSGAAGVVLCDQLWLTEEAPCGAARARWHHLDGSETTLVGDEHAQFRFFSRSGRTKLRQLDMAVAKGEPWQAMLLDFVTDPDDPLLPVGQDIAFADPLAKRYGTVGRIVTALHDGISQALEQAMTILPLAPDSPLAAVHGTRFPIAQGPMTRVSDVAAFAKAVAQEGALPFLALAVMREPEVRAMLTKTRELLGALPWGVGILGFMPLELRQEQLRVLHEIKPPFAIIAGGRPSQARELNELGIATYLHVPSPGLLRGFLAEGARKFVFEGSECGGHTGPRTSFILWEQAIDILTSADVKDPESIQVLFAGGIHDAMSAAMVSVMAMPLVARGMKIGVLMGTAYLFTEQIVQAGAIVAEFQQQAVDCDDTALLQSGVGIYTRCAKTPFCDEFEKLRRELVVASKSEAETLMALELMNIGRLRIASKGIARNPAPKSGAGVERYIQVDSDTQRRDGLYMLGEVARLRKRVCSIAELHAAVAIESGELLRRRHAGFAPKKKRTIPRDDIAIVGMACLLPQAQGLRQYWQNILRGVDAIREVSDDRWRPTDLFDPKRGTPDKVYSKWGGFLDDIAFDTQKYGIAPASLASIEPAQLLSLEVARQALEDAGFDRRPFPRDRTACIFAVGGMNDLGTFYNFRTLLPHYLAKIADLPEQTRKHIVDTLFENELPKWTEDTFPGILANVVAGRIANRLDLGGTNFTVDAACAASLAALDVGIRQLRDGDADVALVGGVDCTNSPIGFMCFAQTHALSPRGRSRPFDESADGIAISEGVGAVVLKRLKDAERDGDRIYALIKGIGSSSDGRNRGLTAPHPPGQVRALKRAYEDAGVDPASVTLIEAHGTGTALGDKSEIESLNLAFGAGSGTSPMCAVGSVKSMIGHTKVAAGMAGLIKAALALQHRILPPTLGVDKPIGVFDGAHSRFYVNTQTQPWLHDGRDHPRHCGVSAFGFGGTNFHTVLAEYTGTYRAADKISLNPREVEIFTFAGVNRSEIESAVQKLLQGLEIGAEIELAQIAFSLYRDQHVVRHANGGHPCRLVLTAASVGELKLKLERVLALLQDHPEIKQPPGLYYRESTSDIGRVCFLFPGQGSQKVNMLRDLVVAQPALHKFFAQSADAADGPQISGFIYPKPTFSEAERLAQQQALNATEIAQPALGMVEMAAFEVLTSHGLQPDFVAGHSYGEYVALCVGGVISRDDLSRLSVTRGRLSAQAPAGAMAALDVDGTLAAATIARHGLKVSIANLNAPDQTIIAGSNEAIDAAVATLSEAALRIKKLAVGTAFHCENMATVRDALAAELAKIKFHPPQIPVYCNLTAAPYPPAANQLRALLARHIAEPVRFADEINELYKAGARVFIECGPGLVLSGLVDRILAGRAHTTLAIDAPGRPGWLQLAQLLTQALAIGLPVHLEPWFAGRGLEECSLDEVFSRARQRATRGALVWRVNGTRAVPWFAPPRKAAQTAPSHTAIPAEDASAAMSLPRTGVAAAAPQLIDSPPINQRRNAMKREEVIADDLPSAIADTQAATSPGSESQFAQIQVGFARLLEFQSEQQRSLRHFFDFQARLAGATQDRLPQYPMEQPRETLKTNPVPPGSASGVPLLPPRAMPVAESLPAMLGSIARAPVLPKQIAAHAGAVSSPERTSAAKTSPPGAMMMPSQAAVVNGSGAAPAAKASAAQFKAELLQAISERTGYPTDMLDLDAHMEADLGIDSIKRIEIFSGLTSRYNLVGEHDEESVIEELSGFKTLNDIIGWYEQSLRPAAALVAGGTLPKKAPTPLSRSSEKVESDAIANQDDPVLCYVVQSSAAHFDHDAIASELPTTYPILLIGPVSALSKSLHQALARTGHCSRQLIPGSRTRAIDDTTYEGDFSSLESIRPLGAMLAGLGQPVGSLINLMGLAGDSAGLNQHNQDARALFLLLTLFEQDLKRSAGAGAGWLVNLTAFGGRFGVGESSALDVAVASASAGTLGVAKSVAREWPKLRVKCIDIGPDMETNWLAAQVMKEMRSIDPEVEVGYNKQGRWRLDLSPRTGHFGDLSKTALEADAVVLITGGAYGITAAIARTLAEKYRPRLVLVGRSALPAEEGDLTRDINNVAELKLLLIKHLQTLHGKVTPAQVDRALKTLLKERQIRFNLDAMRAAGSAVEYHCLDVRDSDAFGHLIDAVYARCGRIDGVLHGAGVIGDKLIGKKPLEAFDAVFDTKVLPALVLAQKLRMPSLKFLAFFSSVAGRFGNIGQCDYSAANEVLNKLADQLSHTWPTLHALSINWGPWDAGMVSDDLRHLYAARSIIPIAPETGRRHFLKELERGPHGEAEVVISSSIRQIAMLRLGR